MKHAEFIVLGLAGVALWLIVKSGQGTKKAPSYARTEEVFNPTGGEWANGWRYFTDQGAGYAIDPAGAYYKDGVRVWAPQ